MDHNSYSGFFMSWRWKDAGHKEYPEKPERQDLYRKQSHAKPKLAHRGISVTFNKNDDDNDMLNQVVMGISIGL